MLNCLIQDSSVTKLLFKTNRYLNSGRGRNHYFRQYAKPGPNSNQTMKVKCSLTYLLTPWSRVHFEELTSPKVVKKFPVFYGSRRFIIPFTRARHLSLPLRQLDPSHDLTSHNLIIYHNIIPHLRLGLPSGLFSWVFPTKILHTYLLSTILTTCRAHLIVLGLITRTTMDEEYRLLSSSFCSFLHSPV
jgi:hypothetical protein